MEKTPLYTCLIDTAASNTLSLETCCHLCVSLQFNLDASNIAVLYHMHGCPKNQGSSQSLGSSSSSSRTSLVTMDITGTNVWVLPLANILHFDYGSQGKLIVSTQHGLYEADTWRHAVDKLQKPTTGRGTIHFCMIPSARFHLHEFICMTSSACFQRKHIRFQLHCYVALLSA